MLSQGNTTVRLWRFAIRLLLGCQVPWDRFDVNWLVDRVSLPAGDSEAQFPIPLLSPLKFQLILARMSESQHAARWAFIQFFSSLVVLLFDSMPERARGSHRTLGRCCMGCPSRKVFMCEPLSLSPYRSVNSTHIPNVNARSHRHTRLHVWMPHARTQHTKVQTNTWPRCDALLLEWLCEAKVTQSHSFIPIIPCVSWVRGLLMASTLWKGTTALTYTLETPAAHSPPPCVRSIARGLYNPSTWLIRPQQNPWEKH